MLMYRGLGFCSPQLTSSFPPFTNINLKSILSHCAFVAPRVLPGNYSLKCTTLNRLQRSLLAPRASWLLQGVPLSRRFSLLLSKVRKNLYAIKLLSVFLLFATLIFLIQLFVPGFVGIDPYYHVKISELMIQEGIFNRFPWTQTSIWNNQFADKEFLFHVYLMPFIRIFPNLMIAGKVAIAVLGGVLFALFYRLLNQFQVRLPLIWTLIVFGVNYSFLHRVCMVRPHVMSLVLTLLFIESLWRHQPWKLLVISLIYPLAYTAAHFLIFIAIIYMIVLWVQCGKLRINLLLLTLVGTTVGMVIHPHFPNNLRVWYVQNALLPIFNWGKGTEFWFVAEHTSLPPRAFIGAYGLTLILFGLAIIVLIFHRSNLSSFTLFIFVLACGFLGMTILSMRFVEYWVPFTVLSCALNLNAVKLTKSSVLKTALKVGRFGLLSFSVVMYVLAMLLIPVRFTPELEEVAQWLENNAPQEAIIFTTSWSDFPQLFYFNSQNYYLFGLDPVYCYTYDANLWNLWVAIVSGQTEHPGVEIREAFHANYVLCTRDPEETQYALTEQLLQDNRYHIGYEDEHHFIFALE